VEEPVSDEGPSADDNETGEATWSVSVDLAPEELALIRTALRLLLSSEDDPDEVDALKRLLARLPEVAPGD
jgi:hypothetical protein